MSSTDVVLAEPSLLTQSLPTELQSRQRWICWNSTDEGGQAIDPTSDEPAASLDVGTRLNEAEHNFETSNYDGVAFIVRSDGKYVGIRLLNCVTGTFHNPEIEDWAEDIIDTVDSYAEIGPSGDNVLIFVDGDIPDESVEAENVRFTTRGVLPVTGKALDSSLPIHRRQEELESIFDECNQQEEDNTVEIDEDITLADVRKTITSEFDEKTWRATEALLSAHATLLIERVKNCTGLVVVGESGSGKTTALRFFEGLDEQVYRTDAATNPSFVSHDSSRTQEELEEEIDLLPRVKHKSISWRDMSTFFAGERQSIHTRMSQMAHLMDGDGFTKDSGSHGRRGYRGDYRFTFLGASTPLSPRAWDVMGHTGFRFVFYHLPSEEESFDEAYQEMQDDVLDDDGAEYEERISRCRDKVHSFLRALWADHGGSKEVDDRFKMNDEARQAIAKLAWVVKYSRAPLREGDNDKIPVREGHKRITAIIRDIARGRAILEGRTTVNINDVGVCAQIALSTMPNKRRPLVRALLNPANGGQLTRNEVEDALGVSKPTALDRMELMDTLGLAEFTEVEDDGRGTKKLELKEDFEWPDVLPFPDR